MLLSILFFFVTANLIQANTLGVCWGRVARQPIPPGVVVKLLQDNNFTQVKLFNADSNVLSALAGSGIEVMVMLTNQEVVSVAQSMDAAQAWVDDNVQAWLPADVNIKYISVGNEPYLSTKQTLDDSLLDAVKNVYQALVNDKLDDQVKITVSFNSEIIEHSTPPSNASFASAWNDELTYIAWLIYNTSSTFSVNIYPFYNFYNPSSALDASFIFFDRSPTSSTNYTNVFDATLDAVLYAIEKAGIPSDIDILIGELGWPSDGNKVANSSLAQEFNNGAIKKMLSTQGTLKRPNKSIKGYIFSLFDEDAKSIKPGVFERKWGIYDNHGNAKYNLDLSGGGDTSKTLASIDGIYLEEEKYCVAKSGADTTNLTLLFSKLCSNGNVSDYGDLTDCTPATSNFTTSGFACASGTLENRVSYAVNQYYQQTSQNSSNCDWGGLAQVTSVDPSYGQCNFRIGLDISKIEQYTASSSKFSFYVLIYIVSLIALLSSFL